MYMKGSMHDANAFLYMVYPQLVKKKLPLQSSEYRAVNDGFIFTIIRFIEGHYAKWILVEAKESITEVGA